MHRPESHFGGRVATCERLIGSASGEAPVLQLDDPIDHLPVLGQQLLQRPDRPEGALVLLLLAFCSVQAAIASSAAAS